MSKEDDFWFLRFDEELDEGDDVEEDCKS